MFSGRRLISDMRQVRWLVEVGSVVVVACNVKSLEVFCSAGMESCKRSVTSLVSPQRCITGASTKKQALS